MCSISKQTGARTAAGTVFIAVCGANKQRLPLPWVKGNTMQQSMHAEKFSGALCKLKNERSNTEHDAIDAFISQSCDKYLEDGAS